MMQRNLAAALLAFVTDSMACTLPTTTLSNTITEGFGLLIQNPAFPVIHDRYMNLAIAGGGDKHLFLSPVPEPAFNMVLGEGVLAQGGIHALIGGEYSVEDNTTKMFMSERNEPRAIFQPIWSCDTDTDNVVVQLAFQTWQGALFGGLICVRQASGFRGYEFRYSPPANPAYDPTNPCMPVTMVVVSGPSTFPTITSPTTTLTITGTTTTPTTTPTTSPTSTPGGPNHPATVNSLWNFKGCQTEATGQRALTGATTATDTMTLEACATFCSAWNYFGVEYSRECYCGNTFNTGSVAAPVSECNFLCKGDLLEYCGAGLRLSVYQKGSVSVSSSSSSSVTVSSSSSSSVTTSSSSTVNTAPSTTSSSSTSLTLLTTTPTTTSPSTSDSTSSSSTSTSTSTSSPLPYTDMTSKGFSFLGCSPEERRATDGPGRTLNGALYAEDTLTNGKCIDFCVSNGYLYAGSEYARECWCGNTVAPGRVPATTKASLANCSKRCGGDASEYCGGDAWLSLYRKCDVGGACVNAVFT